MNEVAKILAIRFLVFASVAGFVIGEESGENVLDVDFDNQHPGSISPESLTDLFGPLHWHGLDGRAVVVAEEESESGKVLETRYPKAAYGSKKSGASFVSKLPPAQEYFLTYKIRFSEDFPFTKGGKLPGLSSSGSEFTGGRIPPKSGGWSARYMWRREGELELYLYHPEMKGPTGDRIALDFRCEPSVWYTLTQRIRVNDPGESNGRIEVWIDGKQYLDRDGLFLRGEETGLIDSFLFSTFFGGGSKTWAPATDCSIQFDDFCVSRTHPESIESSEANAPN